MDSILVKMNLLVLCNGHNKPTKIHHTVTLISHTGKFKNKHFFLQITEKNTYFSLKITERLIYFASSYVNNGTQQNRAVY